MPGHFHTGELEREGALSVPKAFWDDFEDLKNEIHPLFDFSNFNDQPWHDKAPKTAIPITKKYYGRLEPALRLASLFITHEACLPWWTKLVRGSIRRERCHPDHNERCVLTDVAVDSTSQAAVRDVFNALARAKLVRFSFGDLDVSSCKHKWVPAGGSHWGLTSSHPQRGIVCVMLTDRYLQFTRRRKRESQYRFLFLFAKTLTHELAHVVTQFKLNLIPTSVLGPLVRIKTSGEPFYSLHEADNEIGIAWEYFMFGGFMRGLNGLAVGECGIYWRTCCSQMASEAVATRRSNQYTAVVTESILAFFNHRVWTNQVPQEGLGALPIVVTMAAARTPYTNEWPNIGTSERKRKYQCLTEIYESRGCDPHGRVRKALDPSAENDPDSSSKTKDSKTPKTDIDEEKMHPLDFFD